jgi:hypothetical protein
MAEIEQSMLTDQCLSTCIPAVRGRCAAKRPSSPDDRRGAMKRKRRLTEDFEPKTHKSSYKCLLLICKLGISKR